MELPNWVVDDVIAQAKPVPVRIVVMLFRHGRPLVGYDGGRRVYWRGTTQEFARLVGVSKRALIEGERWLVEAGAIVQHARVHERAPHAISAPFDRPSGDNLSPLFESAIGTHDGVSPNSHSDPRSVDSNTIDSRAVTICHRLRELGVTDPERWLASFGADRAEAAAVAAESAEGIRNPAAYARYLLDKGAERDALASLGLEHYDEAPEDRDERIARSQRERYLGGALGHLIANR